MITSGAAEHDGRNILISVLVLCAGFFFLGRTIGGSAVKRLDDGQIKAECDRRVQVFSAAQMYSADDIKSYYGLTLEGRVATLERKVVELEHCKLPFAEDPPRGWVTTPHHEHFYMVPNSVEVKP